MKLLRNGGRQSAYSAQPRSNERKTMSRQKWKEGRYYPDKNGREENNAQTTTEETERERQ